MNTTPIYILTKLGEEQTENQFFTNLTGFMKKLGLDNKNQISIREKLRHKAKLLRNGGIMDIIQNGVAFHHLGHGYIIQRFDVLQNESTEKLETENETI